MASFGRTQPICIRLDRQVLDWFRSKQKRGYQTLINQVLREHVRQAEREEFRRIGRAQELYKQYHSRCFWHFDPKLIITHENFSLVVEGLRKYGGRAGFLLADELCR